MFSLEAAEGFLLKKFYDFLLLQDQVSGTTTSTVLRNLDSDTEYTVTVVPVYPEMEGKSMSENGKTSKFWTKMVKVLSSVKKPLRHPG